MRVRIEDDPEDVLQKAMGGLGLGPGEVAERAGLDRETVRALLRGGGDAAALRRAAGALDLHADSLAAMAEGGWYPEVSPPEGVRCFTTPFPVPGYEEMTVNTYLVWKPGSAEAVLFDTGTSVDPVLEALRAENLRLAAVFFTHTHRDHIAAFDALREAVELQEIRAPEAEPLGDASPVRHGDTFAYGGLTLEARLTDGHSRGGTSYVLGGLDRPVAVVGDALFCLSMGGASADYARALANNRERLLSLPEETLVCPGHGPMTTVGEERARNPFFPEYKT